MINTSFPDMKVKSLLMLSLIGLIICAGVYGFININPLSPDKILGRTMVCILSLFFSLVCFSKMLWMGDEDLGNPIFEKISPEIKRLCEETTPQDWDIYFSQLRLKDSGYFSQEVIISKDGSLFVGSKSAPIKINFAEKYALKKLWEKYHEIQEQNKKNLGLSTLNQAIDNVNLSKEQRLVEELKWVREAIKNQNVTQKDVKNGQTICN